MTRAAENRALAGIRVLDLTIISAGAGATMLLADMGAEVVKVESTTYPDPYRLNHIWPGGDPGADPWNRSAPFNTINRNKLGVTLDLKHPRGRELFLELVKISDVVSENFRVGVMAGFGLDYEALRAVKADLVMISISSQGSTGPESHYGSYGSTLDTLSGLAALTGYTDGRPGWSGNTVNYPDQLANTLAAGAILTGLLRRARTGEGCHIDFSQREAITSLVGEAFLDYSFNRREPTRVGNGDRFLVPHGCYPCQGDDKWVTIAVTDEEQWHRLCNVMGQPELVDDPRFAHYLDRYQNSVDLDAIISEWTVARDQYEVFALLSPEGIATGPVLGGVGVLTDPHLVARGFFETNTHPSAGTYLIRTRPMHFSKTDGEIRLPAPLLGEHNEFILCGLLGLSKEDLVKLEGLGVIGTAPLPEEDPRRRLRG